MQQEDKDFMAKFMMVLGIIVLLAVVIFMVSKLLGKVGGGEERSTTMADAMVEERLQPIGSVVAGAKQTGPIVRSPEEIVNGVCAACHQVGVMGAPKLGDKGDWAPRIAQGMNTLVKHAIEGIRGMPARGGDASLTDEDLRKAVQFMVDGAK